jgi:hypothetical protein
MLKLLERVPNLSNIYLRNMQLCCESLRENPGDRQRIKQMIFYGVRWANCTLQTPEDRESILRQNFIFNAVVDYIGMLTPDELTSTFPVSKRYDGDRWQTKDYFSTMEALREIGMNTVIGADRVLELLWDYENHDLREFVVHCLSLMSAARRLQGRLGIAEEFCVMNGIAMYTRCEDPETGDVEYVDRKACAETRRADALKTLPWHFTIES